MSSKEKTSEPEGAAIETIETAAPIKLHTTPQNILISVLLSSASFLYGYASNVISGALALPSFNSMFLAVDTEPRVGGMLGIRILLGTYSFFAGGVFGALIQQPLADKYGRRMAIAVAGGFLLVGSALAAGSVHYAMFIVARFVTGIGSSMALTLVSLHIVGFNTGYLISSLGSLGFSYMTHPVQWRLNFVINGVIAALLVAGSFYIPESPRWLVSNDRIDEAARVLNYLHNSKYDPHGYIARAELIQITEQIDATKHLKKGYMHIFKTPSLRRRAWATILVWFTAMSTGVLVIANLTPLLFAGLGYGDTAQFGLSTAWLCCCIITAGLGGLMVDKMGRVLFMAIGLGGCALVLAVETAMQAEFLGTSNKHGLASGVAFYFLFACVYNAFLDAGSFVYTAEIWPNHLRSEGWRFYLIFIIISAVGAVAIWYFLPETKGLTLEEIGEKFGEEPQTRHIQDIARSKEVADSRGEEV
ncbi:unnamed protein product [Parascedosporium putredinis]|uniref:Major facilitator superfamily (MFS) profile domain-containing protein n=1 Tax=Parascedosporium putredinis TaxID=1442378 RepID=A0A9P1GZ04_9PEZI|nr:unnamed protein product [Parascedosporium putredinis]CAI7992348.1 unnamed protein product [Parascedosporium putredinis]